MFYKVFNIIFLIISVLLILLGILKKVKNYKLLSNLYNKVYYFSSRHYRLLIIILFLLTLFTSIFQLGSVPYGLHVDEMGMAYDAISISNYGVDRYLNKFPLYLINYGGGQSVMYLYLTVLVIKIFGYSVQVIRMPAVLLRMCIFICCFFMIKMERDRLKTLIFLFLLTIVPYFIMQSRWGLDCNLLVGFLTIAICFLIHSIKKQNNKILLALSGIFFGLSLYTYALSYIVVPGLLFFVCLYLLYIKKIRIVELAILGVPILILATPLILMVLINNGLMNEIKGIVTIPLLKNYRGSEISFSNIPENIMILKNILSYDNKSFLSYNAIPYFGTIYYFSIPFFSIGLINSIRIAFVMLKRKQFNINCIFVFWFLSVLICQLIIIEPNINKANAIFVPIVYFTTVGMVFIVRKNKLLIFPIILILAINFGLFFNYYFYHYDDDNKYNFFVATCYIDAVEYGKELKKENIYIAYDLTAQQYMYILLDNNISPYHYVENDIETIYHDQKITYHFGIPDKISRNDIYIIGSNEELLQRFKNLNFNSKVFGGITVFY